MRILLACLGTLVSATGAARAQDQLVAPGAVWKYLDDGSNQGTAWRQPGFDDASWAAGPAELGYGDGDEATVVSFGPNAAAKYVTTYFRRAFGVADPSGYVSLHVRLERDDGAVVYLNGAELVRSNLPRGMIGYLTVADFVINGAIEDDYLDFWVPPAALAAGTNVLAVEIHQRAANDPDLGFDLELLADTTPSVIRGPYLQRGAPTSLVVRWRTDVAMDSRVLYGPAPSNLNLAVTLGGSVTDHAVEVAGLAPDSTYYYAVGSSSTVLAGADAGHFFVTTPPTGTSTPMRVWVLGDSGTGDANAAAVRDAYYGYTAGRHTNLWLMLGDNAYNSGLDEEYGSAVFDIYSEMLAKSVLWPTRGNHETKAAVYYDLFTLPDAGQAGGLASGTEAYYSFDYADVHFVCLDSQGSNRSVGGPMYSWLQADLAATAQDWIVAFWHHPPYTKGSHDSDTEQQLIDMRQNFLPVLEAGGVDLVLGGHSHSYERSYLIDGHYGTSGTFDPATMLVDGGNGNPAGDGAYDKPDGPHAGAVYAVAGCSGKISGGPLNHPVMCVSLNRLGSVVLDFDAGRLDVSFLDSTGAVADAFTMLSASYEGVYCVPEVSSSGCIPAMGSSGLPSASAPSPFYATASGVETGKYGLLFYGYGPLKKPFLGGTKCVAAPTKRTAIQDSGGAGSCGGSFAYDFNARIQSGSDPALVPGQAVYCQYWYRDPPSASGTGLSDALQFVIRP